jgi:hypothetical protein
MSKVDAIIKEHKDLSLDELVETKKINADQKAQALKKPALQAQLTMMEEQIAAYRKLDIEYEALLAKEKERLERAHAAAIQEARDDAAAQAKDAAEKSLKYKMLTFARFLAAAANRRNGGDETSDDARAVEGALFLVYSGDYTAVDYALKIVEGTDEPVQGTDGTFSGVTCELILPAYITILIKTSRACKGNIMPGNCPSSLQSLGRNDDRHRPDHCKRWTHRA